MCTTGIKKLAPKRQESLSFRDAMTEFIPNISEADLEIFAVLCNVTLEKSIVVQPQNNTATLINNLNQIRSSFSSLPLPTTLEPHEQEVQLTWYPTSEETKQLQLVSAKRLEPILNGYPKPHPREVIPAVPYEVQWADTVRVSRKKTPLRYRKGIRSYLYHLWIAFQVIGNSTADSTLRLLRYLTTESESFYTHKGPGTGHDNDCGY